MVLGVAGGKLWEQGPEEGTFGQTPVKTCGIRCGPIALLDGPTGELCRPCGGTLGALLRWSGDLTVLVPTGELLDGQRGLVPSNFVDFVQDNESRLASTLGNEQDQNLINHASLSLEGENILDLHAPAHIDTGITDNGAGTLGVNIDEIGEDIVPYPRKITLIKQLARSVIVAWEPPAVPPGWGTVSSYNVLVDQETRVSLTLGSRTKALIEKLNTAACTYRISVQCVTSRGNSDELQCTLLVGKDVVVAPSHLRVDNITQISAQLSWQPTNSNYSHVIFLNEEELDVVKAAGYKYQFFNLRPNAAYKVRVLAKPHQMPWQLPLEQREKKEAFVEFSTLPAGEPRPPVGPPRERGGLGREGAGREDSTRPALFWKTPRVSRKHGVCVCRGGGDAWILFRDRVFEDTSHTGVCKRPTLEKTGGGEATRRGTRGRLPHSVPPTRVPIEWNSEPSAYTPSKLFFLSS